MTTYFFPDATDERGNATPVRFHSPEPLEDRELQERMLRYNATSVQVTPDSAGAPRLTGHDELAASHAARRAR